MLSRMSIVFQICVSLNWFARRQQDKVYAKIILVGLFKVDMKNEYKEEVPCRLVRRATAALKIEFTTQR